MRRQDDMGGLRTRREVRLDFASAGKAGATPIEVRPDGYRVYEGTAAFGDVVLDYPDLDPPRREYVPAGDAMSAEALASLVGAPFTFGPRTRGWDGVVSLPGDHAPDLLSPETVGDATEGAVLAAWRYDPPNGGPPELRVRVIVYSRAGIDMIERGVVDLSAGYELGDLEWTAGVSPSGQRYDAVQRRRRYNHLNGVDGARSKAPDGRSARFDGSATTAHHPAVTDYLEALAGSSYSLNTYARSHMEDAALTTTTQTSDLARGDADMGAPMMDAAPAMLGPDDLAKIKEMSPEAQKAMMALLAKAGMAEAEGAADEVAAGDDAEVAEEVAEGDAAALAEPSDAAPIEAIMKQLDDLMGRVAALEGGRGDAPAGGAGEAAAKPEGEAKPGARKDTAGEAAAAAKRLADARVRQDQERAEKALCAEVRKDGHKGATVAEAEASMLGVIETHLPGLHKTAAKAAAEKRYDAVAELYQQAENIRRDSIARDTQAGFAAFHGAPDSLLGDAPTFTMPARAVPTNLST